LSAGSTEDLAIRWSDLWARLHLPIPPGAGFADLLARYREPHRAYHTDQHLRECLDWLDQLRALAHDPAALELAIWYHDAIYRPRRSDNEQASADLAATHQRAAGATGTLTAEVSALILSTTHRVTPPPGDAALLTDIDLAILGAPAARYAEYEAQIRTEYRWVPGFLFRRRRVALLREFLGRPRLYTTPEIFARLEAQARHNLADSIRALSPEG
jgi:predicted metal-dependent HD superfamily phosphohydrolase